MPRINTRVLCFEDISMVRQPIIDTPVGRMSPRQLAGMGSFALLAWAIFQGLGFLDIVARLVPAIVVFFVGVVFFTWPIKTVPPEKVLLLMLGIGKKRAGAKRAVERRVKQEAGGRRIATPPAAPTIKVVRAQAVVGEPFKVVGVLRDPRTGRPLANHGFEVLVDGVLQYKSVTDEQGGFEVVYMPQSVGVIRIVVRPEGVVGAEQGIEVTVAGSRRG